MKYSKFNLNHNILVQITKKGFEHLEKTVKADYVVHCILNRRHEIDGEVWYKLQAHQVMELFGEYLDGISTNILIPKD